MPNQISFNELAKFLGATQISLERTESAEERAARLEREASEAEHARWKERIVLIAVLVAGGVILLFSGVVLFFFDPQKSPDATKWATGALTAVLSFAFGLLSGGKILGGK